jgi:acyl-coenzyme A thioesterase PaaI-like protein
MRIITLTAVAISALVAAHGARADGVCMTAADLAFAPAIARALPVIDTDHKGCVTGEQVQRYRAAVKQARTEEKARIVTLLASAN